jgi:hypothetical protein
MATRLRLSGLSSRRLCGVLLYQSRLLLAKRMVARSFPNLKLDVRVQYDGLALVDSMFGSYGGRITIFE